MLPVIFQFNSSCYFLFVVDWIFLVHHWSVLGTPHGRATPLISSRCHRTRGVLSCCTVTDHDLLTFLRLRHTITISLAPSPSPPFRQSRSPVQAGYCQPPLESIWRVRLMIRQLFSARSLINGYGHILSSSPIYCHNTLFQSVATLDPFH